MSRTLILVLLWLVQATFVAVLVNAEWLEKQMAQERSLVSQYMGESTESALATGSDGVYAQLFVDSGAVQWGYAKLLPDPTQPKYGMDGLAPWWFTWLQHRLDAFWWMVYQCTYRLKLTAHWLPYFAVLIACAGIDGLTQRQVKRAEFAYASSDRYILAKRSLLLLIAAPFLYSCVPVLIHPLVVPVWGMCVAAAVSLLLGNAQHQI